MGSVRIFAHSITSTLYINIRKCFCVSLNSANWTHRSWHFTCSALNSSLPNPAMLNNLPEKDGKIPTDKIKPPFVGTNLADFADHSKTLQKLIDLGVQISSFNKDPSIGKMILCLDYDQDIVPYLEFLKNIGVSNDELRHFISKNPYIFKCYLDDLQVRINYLQSKKFTSEMIKQIIVKNPLWLSMEVKVIDKKLGELQGMMKLSGNEVRSLVTSYPKVVLLDTVKLKLNLFTLKLEIGLSKADFKKVILRNPMLLKTDNNDLINTFDYLLSTMKIPISLILQQSRVLTCRPHILSLRHGLLNHLGRDQYNPKLPGYVSLEQLVKTDDKTFCRDIAKISLDRFYDYVKSM